MLHLTLNQVNKKICEIYDQFEENNDLHNNKQYILELHQLEQSIEKIYNKISNIKQICTNKYISKRYNESDNKKKKLWNPVSILYETHDIAKNVKVHTKTVDNIYEMRKCDLYWVKNINQFAININGVIFRGNVGNIYNKDTIQSNSNVNQTIICKNKNKCKTLLNGKVCKFYHDPLDLVCLLHKKEITQEIFDLYKSQNRNFINTTWLYTDLPFNKKNINMRHFGSQELLSNEFELLKINNPNIKKHMIDNYQHQTMHDMLVILGLHGNELIDSY